MKIRCRHIGLVGLSILCLAFSASPDLGLSSGYVTMRELFRNPRVPVTRAFYPVSESWSTYDLKRRVRESGSLTAVRKKKKRTGESSRKLTDAPPAPEGYEPWRPARAKITAYEPSRRSCGSFANGKTSTGDNAWKMDGVAVAPQAIPYGTKIWIPGIGFREADDTGSAMKDSWREDRQVHIDVRMTYYYQARNWGVQHDVVYLYRPTSSD